LGTVPGFGNHHQFWKPYPASVTGCLVIF
jgi:hypothetical protein